MKQQIKKIGLLLIITIITLFTTAMVYASCVEVQEDIRIGLYYGSSAIASVNVSSPGGIEVGIMVDGEFEQIDEIEPNENITISKGDEKGSVYVSGIGEIGSEYEYPYFKPCEDDEISVLNVNGKRYRGNLEIRRFSDSDMTIINHLSMQDYLYGVVPREIGGNSPIEAVKAQAIVARTYATKNYEKRMKWGFNLYPTVDDQAYGGYDWENPNSNRAVDETNGQVIVYNGELIGGYYFSTSGGYTESSENVWGGKLDYLKAVPDLYEPEIEGNTTWEVEFTAIEIRNKLAAKGVDVGEILEIEPVEYTDAGRVLELKITGTDGETTLTKSKTREYLGLKSQWYSVNDDAPVVKEVDEDDIPTHRNENYEEDDENNNWWMNDGNEKDEEKDEEYIVINPDYSIDEDKIIAKDDESEKDNDNKKDKLNKEEEKVKEEKKEMKPLLKAIVNRILGDKVEEVNKKYEALRSDSTFVFRGRGWGHAVGMSQNGAKGMASEGFTCEEIIEWYYSGVEVVD